MNFENKLFNKYNDHQITLLAWAALGALCLAVFFPLTYSMSSHGSLHQFLQMIDEGILIWVDAKIRSPFLNHLMLDFSAFGSLSATILYCTVACMFFAILRDYPAILHLLVTAGGSVGISFLTKDYFLRPRPEVIPYLVKASGFSYPSGHSVSSAAVMVTLAILGIRHVKTHGQRIMLFLMAATIIGIVSASRIYLGVHYPSDTLGGALLGAAWALFMAFLFAKTHHRSRSSR